VDDPELLARLRAGDRAAFDAIFRAQYAAMVGVAESVVRERAVAEEVAQDVFLELWRRRESLAVQESLRAYLFRSVRNRALNHLRHGRVQRAAAPFIARDEAAPATAPARMAEREIDAAVRDAVAALPDPVRQVFEMSRTHHMKYGEIAASLGISVKTVEARMGRALKELRERLARWLPGAGD
jgi:RNA polymerase sigma-70 factor, ECF subfamily